MKFADLRVMVIGGHPDDADQFAGCTAIKWADRGARVRFVSVCNGEKGWHLVPNDGVAERRRGETAAAAKAYDALFARYRKVHDALAPIYGEFKI